MTIDRRKFIKSMGLGLTTMSLNAKNLVNVSGESESLFVTDRMHPKPAPKGYDRLPLSWYKKRVRTLQREGLTPTFGLSEEKHSQIAEMHRTSIEGV